eukprot:scaffold1130_cov74-Phaeocystis_antarctica.AAC.10
MGHGCGVTRCDGCSALAACDGQSWRLAPLHSRGRERGSVAHVVAARLLDPRVHVVGVSQPTMYASRPTIPVCGIHWHIPGRSEEYS